MGCWMCFAGELVAIQMVMGVMVGIKTVNPKRRVTQTILFGNNRS